MNDYDILEQYYVLLCKPDTCQYLHYFKYTKEIIKIFEDLLSFILNGVTREHLSYLINTNKYSDFIQFTHADKIEEIKQFYHDVILEMYAQFYNTPI